MNVLHRMGVVSTNAKILMVATFVNVKMAFSLMVMQKHVQVSFVLNIRNYFYSYLKENINPALIIPLRE